MWRCEECDSVFNSDRLYAEENMEETAAAYIAELKAAWEEAKG